MLSAFGFDANLFDSTSKIDLTMGKYRSRFPFHSGFCFPSLSFGEPCTPPLRSLTLWNFYVTLKHTRESNLYTPSSTVMKAREEINELTKYTSQGYSPKCIHKAAKQFATTIDRRLRQRKIMFSSALGRFTIDINSDSRRESAQAEFIK